MTGPELVIAAAQVRWVLLRRNAEPPDAATIKAIFLTRWPNIRASEVLAICRLAAAHKEEDRGP